MSAAPRLLRGACLAALGACSVPRGGAGLALAGAIAALAAGSAALWLLQALLRRTVPSQARDDLHCAIDDAFLMLVPYTLLASLCTLLIGWELGAAFASAGLLAAGGAARSELSRRGARTLPLLLSSILVLMPLAAGWGWAATKLARMAAP